MKIQVLEVKGSESVVLILMKETGKYHKVISDAVQNEDGTFSVTVEKEPFKNQPEI